VLKVTDLTRKFSTAEETVIAVDGACLELADGVFAAIVGKSGSGKSTLLSLLGTLDKPTAGTITVDGVEVSAMNDSHLTAYRRNAIGFVFQSYNLIPNLSALQNVALPMEFAGVPKADRDARAAKLLKQVGLSADKQRRRPGRLSGGEQQRVAIARSLANRPSLILADEPTGNLDSETGALIVDLLRDLARCENVTIIAVTHDPDLAATADRTFRLRDGRIAEEFFPTAVAEANQAYDAWLAQRRDAETEGAFVSAIERMIEAAPAGRKLSAAKIRERYVDAAGVAAFEGALAGLSHHDDLLESE
jgi:putative ABC transport system ATP-binding protein